MKMCYHATCIYSFCGHWTTSATSQGPLRNAPRYQEGTTAAQEHQPDHQAQAQAQAQDHAIATTIDVDTNPSTFPLSTSFPFPSPQEFEFARSLHHSVPASPITPTSTSTSTPSQRASQISASPSTPPVCGSALRCYHSTKSHPFRTFILPTLCPPCRTTRDENIARFEAGAIGGIIEREGADIEGQDGGEGNGSGDGDGSRDGSIRRRKKRMVGRKLMPLILVEEGRLKKEIERLGEEDQGTGIGDVQVVSKEGARSRMGLVAAESTLDGSDAMAEGLGPSVEVRARIGGAVEVVTPPTAATPSPLDASVRAETPPSVSKWSWRNRKVSHARSKSVSTINEADMKFATGTDVPRSPDEIENPPYRGKERA